MGLISIYVNYFIKLNKSYSKFVAMKITSKAEASIAVDDIEMEEKGSERSDGLSEVAGDAAVSNEEIESNEVNKTAVVAEPLIIPNSPFPIPDNSPLGQASWNRLSRDRLFLAKTRLTRRRGVLRPYEPAYNSKGQQTYCVCRHPDDGDIMVQCDTCKEWYHGRRNSRQTNTRLEQNTIPTNYRRLH